MILPKISEIDELLLLNPSSMLKVQVVFLALRSLSSIFFFSISIFKIEGSIESSLNFFLTRYENGFLISDFLFLFSLAIL